MRSSGRSWGVVVVGQRRGSLFPEDDLAMLGQVGAQRGDGARSRAAHRRAPRAGTRARPTAGSAQIESRVELMLDSIKDYAMLVLDAGGRVAAWQPGAAARLRPHAREMSSAARPPGSTTCADRVRRSGSTTRASGAARAARRDAGGVDGAEFVGTTMIRPLVEDAGGTPGFRRGHARRHRSRAASKSACARARRWRRSASSRAAWPTTSTTCCTAILGYADWLSAELAGDPRQAQVGARSRRPPSAPPS